MAAVVEAPIINGLRQFEIDVKMQGIPLVLLKAMEGDELGPYRLILRLWHRPELEPKRPGVEFVQRIFLEKSFY